MYPTVEYFFQLFMATFPYWLLSLYPFWNRLRFSKPAALLLVFLGEMVVFAGIGLCALMGIPYKSAEFLFIPICFLVDIIAMKIQPSIILFFFLFIMDYLLMIRGIVFYLLTRLRNGEDFMSWSGFGLHLILLGATLPLIFYFLRRTANRMLQVNAPRLWRTFWLVPGFCSFIVLMFTAQQTPDSVGQLRYLFARVGLLFCCFIVYYILLSSLESMKKQALLEHQAESDAALLRLQKKQYHMLLQQIKDTREARHNLRQHLTLIQAYLRDGNKEALNNYITLYAAGLPGDTTRTCCANYAVNTIINYYEQEALAAHISFYTALESLPQQLFIAEPDVCVLLGNLLENAIEAEKDVPAKEHPFIKISALIRNDDQLILTVDNGPAKPPVEVHGNYQSSRHDGMGIGTASVKNIAAHYNGTARFQWTDGIFYASVLLTRPDTGSFPGSGPGSSGL